MIGDPVEHHLHPLVVRGLHQGLHVGEGPAGVPYARVVLDAIRRTYSVLLPLRVDGHQVKDVGAEGLYVVEASLDGLQLAGVPVKLGIYLINLIVGPGGCREFKQFFGLGGRGGHDFVAIVFATG